MSEFPLSIVPPVIPYEDGDEPVHSEAAPFCSDQSCPCHWDEELTHSLLEAVRSGLLTSREAMRIHDGRQL